MNRWPTRIDGYCERTDFTFWSEPLNAITNVAFLIAAYAAWRLWRERGGSDRPALALILVTVAVGVGSFLFHTLATVWAMLADVIPIAIFIYGYFLLAMRRFVGLGLILAIPAVVAFLAASRYGAPPLRGLLGGGAGYAPALIALIGVGGALLIRARDAADSLAGRALLASAGVFAVSLTFRTLDLRLCDALPMGTHFLWHLLNALTLFILLRAAIAVGPRSAS